MKLGLGLYRQNLDDRNMAFARQCGCTHIVAHLTDYFAGKNPEISSGDERGWGVCQGAEPWSQDELDGVVALAKRHGLKIAALENLNPAFWHDILLGGPKRKEQADDLKALIRRIGKAGIPVLGYNFSLAGVWGWDRGPFARGGAMSVGMRSASVDFEKPIPSGMVWNMIYDTEAEGTVAPVSSDELWLRLQFFLDELLPVAEEAGVALACHPDDPPVETLRQTARGINHPEKYDRLIAAHHSPMNQVELCLGSVQEMRSGDVYETAQKFVSAGKVAYIHFRNVKGKVPDYYEVFVDEGDIDMLRMMRILHESNFDGVLVPDHTPALECDAPWHAGMAFALGYMRACMQAVSS
ncbi:MAG: mannonate dehydratase [Pseudomonadota bacterium]